MQARSTQPALARLLPRAVVGDHVLETRAAAAAEDVIQPLALVPNELAPIHKVLDTVLWQRRDHRALPSADGLVGRVKGALERRSLEPVPVPHNKVAHGQCRIVKDSLDHVARGPERGLLGVAERLLADSKEAAVATGARVSQPFQSSHARLGPAAERFRQLLDWLVSVRPQVLIVRASVRLVEVCRHAQLRLCATPSRIAARVPIAHSW